ncbi:MAG: phospholipase [Candidatus Riflebacteria bacterium]|nr:phospholipase [Candidatus Riflebacteria bacterium]
MRYYIKKIALLLGLIVVAVGGIVGWHIHLYKMKVTEYSRTTPRSIRVGNLERTYQLFVPTTCSATMPVPLLLVLHGGYGTGTGTQYLTLGGFNDQAQREGFIVVYPDGIERNWNDGREIPTSTAHRLKLDDVGFLKAMIESLKKEYRIDSARIFSTGISNGAFMSARLGIECADIFAAIAPVTGSLPKIATDRPRPAEPVSVLMINSTADPLVPFAGGMVGTKRKPRGNCISVNDAVRFWVQADGCATEPVITDEPDRDPSDGTRVKKHLFSGGRNGSEVILYEIIGGGHTWPSGHQYAPEAIIGKTSKDLDACKTIWEFFKSHPKIERR